MLQAREVANTGHAADNGGNPEAKPDKPQRKVLLVEDNPINQKVALRILAQHGFKADTAMNGQEALDAFEKQFYDIVLMDVQMPSMDGVVATRHLRIKYGPDKPYIIAVTANVTDEDRRNCFEAGMNDFVTKPIRPDILLKAMIKAPQE